MSTDFRSNNIEDWSGNTDYEKSIMSDVIAGVNNITLPSKFNQFQNTFLSKDDVLPIT